jgi:hypothetical protein
MGEQPEVLDRAAGYPFCVRQFSGGGALSGYDLRLPLLS